MNKKGKQQNSSWRNGSSIVMITMICVFALVGTPAIIEGILYLLPTSALPVEIVGRDSRASGGGSFSAGARKGMTYFATFRTADGDELEIKVPANLHQRAIGATNLNDVQLHVTRPGKRPVSISIANKSVIIPGSTLDKIVNLNKDKDQEQTKSSAENRQYYSLLMPLTGLLIGGVFIWSIVGYLLWKLPSKQTFPWPILIAGLLIAISGGTWWALTA